MPNVMALPAVLTADTVKAVQAQLLQRISALPAEAVVVLDVEGVQSFDSAGLALLLACRRAAAQQQKGLQVRGWTQSLQSLAQVYGVMPLLDPDAPALQQD